RVYWIARATTATAPTAFTLDADENGVWTLGTGTSATTSTQAFSASIPVSGTGAAGTSGEVFSPLTANGTLNVWAVFVSNTGNRSAVTVTPQISGIVMVD
ncbi:MAG TPA: hypothetical protein PKJ63_04060, partial [Cyclobacteriaceae bacterium]|nr:hypothetical protein [Cyclobacteriaceae bacterium]